jgi:hypothetical protein
MASFNCVLPITLMYLNAEWWLQCGGIILGHLLRVYLRQQKCPYRSKGSYSTSKVTIVTHP